MKTQQRILNILMNGMLVGKLTKTTSGGVTFTYDQSWLDNSGARPVSLSLPLISDPFAGDVVYNFFDNLLPDNPQVKALIQTQFMLPTDQPFDLLSSIGKDCVGALQILSGQITNLSTSMSFNSVTEKEIAAILRGTQNFPLGMTGKSDEFRISIAGAQDKTAFLYWNSEWNRPLGATPTTHIFKLPIGHIQNQNIDLTDSCENEWLCSEIAAAFGLPVAKSEIKYFEEMKTLVVERFDRKISSNGKMILRLPQEDMCQALGVSPNLKYENDGGPGIKSIMRLLLSSADPEKNRDLFFKSQILFWLLAAIDGHAKNFSINIEAEGKYNLTPLYDIISAYPLIANKHLHERKIKMAMALSGKSNHYNWYGIQRRHFLSTAQKANYPVQRAEQLLDEMFDKVDGVIDEVSNKLPSTFPSKIYVPIFEGMKNFKNDLSKNI